MLDIGASHVALLTAGRAAWVEKARAAIGEDGHVRNASTLTRAAKQLTGKDEPPETTVWLPEDQVLARDLEAVAGDTSDPATVDLAFVTTTEATGQPEDDLAVVIQRAAGERPARVFAAYAQSCREAKAYAEGWGFTVVAVSARHLEPEPRNEPAPFLSRAELMALARPEPEAAHHRAARIDAPETEDAAAAPGDPAKPARTSAPPATVPPTSAPWPAQKPVALVASVAVALAIGAGAWLALNDTRSPGPGDNADTSLTVEATPTDGAGFSGETVLASASSEHAEIAEPSAAVLPVAPTARTPELSSPDTALQAPEASSAPAPAPALGTAAATAPVAPDRPDLSAFAEIRARADQVMAGDTSAGATEDAAPDAADGATVAAFEPVWPLDPPRRPSSPILSGAGDIATPGTNAASEPLPEPIDPASFSVSSGLQDASSRGIDPDRLALSPAALSLAKLTLPDPDGPSESEAVAIDMPPTKNAPETCVPPSPRPGSSNVTGGDAEAKAAAETVAAAEDPDGDATDPAAAVEDEGASGLAGSSENAPDLTPVPALREADDDAPALTASADVDAAPDEQNPDNASTGVPAAASEPAPEEVAEDQEDREPPSRLAALEAPMPGTRPDRLGAPIRPSGSAGAASTVPLLPQLSKSAPQSVQRAAAEAGLPLDRAALIGILNLETGRQALLRLPDGRYERLTVGDRLGGWEVNMIGVDAMRLSKDGQARTLLLVSR